MKNVAIGENSTREMWNGCCYGRHAEMDAVKHLPINTKTIKKTIVDLVVIKINHNGTLGLSKPCQKCLDHMKKIRGYKIRNIHYSCKDGSIQCEKFNSIYYSDNQHKSRRFRRH